MSEQSLDPPSDELIAAAGVATEPVESPPPADQPARESAPDPLARLHQLAAELMRNRNRRLLIEFFQLRRALR